jgi:hypothetical protein
MINMTNSNNSRHRFHRRLDLRIERTGPLMLAERDVSLELPVMLHVGEKAAVMGIIEALTPQRCRLRSLAPFHAGTTLSFTIRGNHHEELALRGRVESVTSKPPRVHHELVLDPLEVTQRKTLSEIVESQQQRANDKTLAELSHSPLLRTGSRVPVDFELAYSVEGGPYGVARAENISTGGMMIVADNDLGLGSTIDVTFHLPNSHEPELNAASRVVAHRPAGDGRTVHHLAFFNLDPAVRERIARFVER